MISLAKAYTLDLQQQPKMGSHFAKSIIQGDNAEMCWECAVPADYLTWTNGAAYGSDLHAARYVERCILCRSPKHWEHSDTVPFPSKSPWGTRRTHRSFHQEARSSKIPTERQQWVTCDRVCYGDTMAPGQQLTVYHSFWAVFRWVQI